MAEAIYLSARFSQQDDMKRIRDYIHAMTPHRVCSSWLDQTGPEPSSLKQRRRLAVRDLSDCRNATLAILDYSLPPRGGREIEHGVFLSKHTTCWIVNNLNRGNIFTSLYDEEFPDWDAAMAHLTLLPTDRWTER